MKQYIDLCTKVLDEGIRKTNRTGIDHIGYTGDMMQFDLSKGFPIVTTKKLAFKSCVAEMLGFLKAYDNASSFRKLGCNVWDENANNNTEWMNSPHRKGTDDLGRIYGRQARNWRTTFPVTIIDQLWRVYDDLRKGIDNRREIITHWNPGELNEMALPPCHLLYQFGIQGDRLNLSMYQRSCDVPLGIPFNITGYAWLLSVMAHITGFEPGVFTHFLHDIHIYENQIPGVRQQIQRVPRRLPELIINEKIKTLQDMESWVTTDDFTLEGYEPCPAIKFPFSV